MTNTEAVPAVRTYFIPIPRLKADVYRYLFKTDRILYDKIFIK